MGVPDAQLTESERMLTTPFAVVTAAALALFIYIGVMIPLLPRLIEDKLGGHEIDIGLNLAVFSAAAIAVRPRLSRYAEQHGLRRTIVLGAVLCAVATVACIPVGSRWALLPLRALQGMGEGAVFVGAATSINNLAPRGRSAEASSYFSVAVFAGLGIGPFIGEAVIGKNRFALGLLVAAGFAVLSFMLAMLMPPFERPDDEVEATTGPRFHRAAIPTGAVLALGVGGFFTFTAFMPAHALAVGLNGSKWVFAIYAGVCLVIRVLGAKVPDQIGHARALTIALSFMSVGLLTLYAWPRPAGVFVGAVIVAIGISFNYPSLMAMTVNAVPERERVRTISTFTMFFEIGTAGGGLLLGGLANVTSKRVGFLGGACACAIGLIVLWKVAVPRSRPHLAV
jgi:MFS family permease